MPKEASSGGSRQESPITLERANALSLRDRIVGAILALIVLAAQTQLMGPVRLPIAKKTGSGSRAILWTGSLLVPPQEAQTQSFVQ
ncbi:MAG: hypothetical protein WB676_27135 [Bryobacteraceae bacterium]